MQLIISVTKIINEKNSTNILQKMNFRGAFLSSSLSKGFNIKMCPKNK